ncbi:MAG: BatA domain-containing protein, partial [Rhodospirillaceae bacterium]|nr:BatA domain-containing protein [Rhodospirillaceae bacterium]
MLEFGPISFASPWILAAAAALPAIWLLLRITPPAVTRVSFPAVRLMFDLQPTERTPARTPWWLVALRMLIAGLVIAGLAEPLW